MISGFLTNLMRGGTPCTTTTMSIENKPTNGSSLKKFNIPIYRGTPCILSGATNYRGLAGRAGCWPACHLIGPFLVVILSLRMESHSPTTTFQPKWKRDFFSPMPLPSTTTSLRGQPKTPSYWPTYYILRSELMFEFFLESLISTPVGIAIEHS